MTYDELDNIVDGGWSLFLDHLAFNGIDSNKVASKLNNKDCFNGVFDAIIACVDLEAEE